MKRWVKLVEGNDWGVRYLALPEKRLNALGSASTKNAYPLKAGDVLRVRWPDGLETEETVTMRKESDTVGDWGRTYIAESDVPHVAVSVHGLTVSVRLDLVEIEVDA